MVDALTDNTNRTVADVRSVFAKSGGRLAKSGSVAYLFERKGLIQVNSENIDELELLELVADSGADDMETDEGIFVIITPVEAFETVQTEIARAGIEIEEARLVRVPITAVKKETDQVRQTETLVTRLEDLQDVQEVFTNLEM